jgi:hypothetical protein
VCNFAHSLSGLAQTAGGQNYFSRQPTGLVGGQEHCDPSDVRGLPDATEWRHGKQLFLEVTSDSDYAARAPSVAVAPGLIEFTRIIFDPNSFASTRVIASTALLVAV